MRAAFYKGLQPATRRWCLAVETAFQLEEHNARLLLQAARAWDAAEAAHAVLQKAGFIYEDRFGAPRRHPANSILTDARTAFARIMRELALDGAVGPEQASRPPSLRSGRVG